MFLSNGASGLHLTIYLYLVITGQFSCSWTYGFCLPFNCSLGSELELYIITGPAGEISKCIFWLHLKTISVTDASIGPNLVNFPPFLSSHSLLPSPSVPCSICPPLHTAEDKLVLSNRFLHTKTCLCGWHITLCHHLLWISTDAWRWRDVGRSSGCSPHAEVALGWER